MAQRDDCGAMPEFGECFFDLVEDGWQVWSYAECGEQLVDDWFDTVTVFARGAVCHQNGSPGFLALDGPAAGRRVVDANEAHSGLNCM